MNAPERLGALEARRAIAAGRLTAAALVEACLERIGRRNGTVAAWAFLDPGAARARARALDDGPERGLLHGLPIGVKDILDTAQMPAGYGSEIYTGHRPGRDAAAAASVLAAGAVLLGKTVTTEFANRRAGPTRNPHDPTRTPGGSSSGSAAAVADFQAPLAIGTQTGGSVIRPAAYCGVVGFKPSFQHIGNGGVRANTEAFDTVGLMARCVEDIALLRAACMEIPFAVPEPDAVQAPRLALLRTPWWEAVDGAGRAALDDAARALSGAGAQVMQLELPQDVVGLCAAHGAICTFESSRNYADELARTSHLISDDFHTGRIAAGEAVSLAAFHAAHRSLTAGRPRFEAWLMQHGLDALLTPPAPGEASPGLAKTGAATFNSLWTALHMPCVTLPFGMGPGGMPTGVQLVARRHEDAALLHLAAWAERILGRACAT
jgi:Asp-tRNA(Asn)/Glu-tRNA(Gln) amidotransferase A subunit family amidase